MFADTTTLGPAIDKLDAIRDWPNTSEVPKNCNEVSDISVQIKTSCFVDNPATICEPACSLKNPAVLVRVGCQFSGSGPISGSTLAQRTSSGS